MPKDIQFVLVGFGQIGKKHARLIENCPNSQLVAIIENNESIIPKENKIPVFNSISSFIKSGIQADVASICSPNFLHAEHCLQAIENGLHVLCEKPMGLKKSDCEKVINLSLQKGKLVFVVMQNRYSTTAEWLKSLVEQNILGQIYYVQTNCFWNRDDRYYSGSEWKGKSALDGGVLFTQFSHFVDMLYWCFGEMNNFKSSLKNFNHQRSTEFEDTGTVSFDFLKSGMGTLNFSTSVWDKNMESSISVIAEKGSLKIGGQYMEKVEHCHIKDYESPNLDLKQAEHLFGKYTGNDAHHFLSIQNVVETLLGKSTISTNAMEGLKVVEMIEMIYKN
jgi:UDP-N-acetyl-2-amino-2-deoxyglucuronate dehydrogenase